MHMRFRTITMFDIKYANTVEQKTFYSVKWLPVIVGDILQRDDTISI